MLGKQSPSLTQHTPCFFIIFGATGNLAAEKLFPALYALEAAQRLPPALRFVAVARRDWSQDQWQHYLLQSLNEHLKKTSCDADIAQKLSQRFDFVDGDYTQASTYQALKDCLAAPRDLPAGSTCENLAFYLAIRPADYLVVATQLHEAGFAGGALKHRIVIEKPFGENLDSAQILNQHLHQYFDENQIFRIDHYLGKETVQNMLVFRFANTLIEPIWNRNYIDHVQITVAEQYGVENRASYFDNAGTLRDMLQNHLLQLLTVTAMEPPATLNADALRDEKVKVLRSIRPIPQQSVQAMAFRAQYAAGSINGQPVPSYREEPNVAPHSTTETFVAAKFYVDNWRWKGVPFYLRTGKRMAEKMSSIAIRFKQPPQQLFRETALEWIEPNWIIFSLYPNEVMRMEIHAKQPGLEMITRIAELQAPYRQPNEPALEAYETLLLDVIQNDRSLFIRFDEVEMAWHVVDPILRQWAATPEFIHTYPAGSWGPEESSRLFDREDQQWRNN
ncbi:MAG: glucose-6-phosphate dehydrogenase [Pseudomonadales bacterium]|jgi:glucose-6-phosphate 1-dehydrogenase